jgi:hypothetical protein
MSDTTVGPVPSDEAAAPPSEPAPPTPVVEAEAEAEAETGTEGGTEAEAEAGPAELPARPSGPRRPAGRLLRAAGVTVAAALVGVVIGVGIVELGYHGSTPKTEASAAGPAAAPTPTAAPTAPAFGAKSNGNHFGSLRDLLIPVPAGFVLGPDYDNYGNDAELTAEQLTAEIDEGLKDLPADKRAKMREFWNGLHVKGTGVRTFKTSASDLVVSIKLRQFNQDEVQKENEYTALFGDDTGIFRGGPEIPGHPEAHCYLMPVAPGAPIDYLECSAAEGDLLVIMDVEGVALLPKDKIVSLFTAQLDRLARPGASA